MSGSGRTLASSRSTATRASATKYSSGRGVDRAESTICRAVPESTMSSFQPNNSPESRHCFRRGLTRKSVKNGPLRDNNLREQQNRIRRTTMATECLSTAQTRAAIRVRFVALCALCGLPIYVPSVPETLLEMLWNVDGPPHYPKIGRWRRRV